MEIYNQTGNEVELNTVNSAMTRISLTRIDSTAINILVLVYVNGVCITRT